MRSLLALTKKELTEQLRTGKLAILGAVFVLFGIMNPAIAKLTPLLMEILSDTLSGSGIIVTEVTVTALDSWMQFFKNIPMGLILFVLLEGGIFTKEYQSGTLTLSLSKGLERYKVVVAKSVTLVLLWSLGYWLCFGITYTYNAYFWDNTIAKNLIFSILSWWIFGLWVISLSVLFSVLSKQSSGVLLGTGGIVFGTYLPGILPKINEYLPTRLTDGNSLIYGLADTESYVSAWIITIATGLSCLAVSIPLFNKKSL